MGFQFRNKYLSFGVQVFQQKVIANNVRVGGMTVIFP